MPERETREVLRGIATYHKQGEHRNEWELKDEYKSAAAPSAGGNGGTGKQIDI